MKGNISCGACQGKLIAKRGVVLVHHFSHEAKCTAYASSSEPMTPWHSSWQDQCQQEHVQVAVRRTLTDGRNVLCMADIVNKDGTVIEIQHSNISASDMAKREECHSDMIWVLDGITEQNAVVPLFTCKTVAQKPFVVMAVERSQLNFAFRATRKVYFETPYGIIRLLQKLERATFLGKVVRYGEFMGRYFNGILEEGKQRLPCYQNLRFDGLVYNQTDMTVGPARQAPAVPEVPKRHVAPVPSPPKQLITPKVVEREVPVRERQIPTPSRAP
ncbi:hypothetical protein KFL_011110060 [Klebsormidium nitens]|uniref:Uncharacterized protein n=1 Tax=Klebsormidium nitens TaxID=105231 RepID=A0A1Y1ITS7_KLENI|nr:hypothetical protein KFL_011110060 [Klebsormidium nitens]|eukprot:GAQ92731.1 hypothetical protein KFL_011110060 [Klebsormidium nitens]